MERQQCSFPPSPFLYPLHPSCIPKTILKFAQKGAFFIEEGTTKSVWSPAFCWRCQQRICWRSPVPQGQVPVLGSSMGCLPRLWEAKGWQGSLNPSVLNQSSGKQDHKACSRNKEDEHVVLLKRFCKSLHKKFVSFYRN